MAWNQSLRPISVPLSSFEDLPLRSRHPFMTLQAFIDESVSPATFVFGGFIATTERLASFAKDWEELLPLAPLDQDNKRIFKFAEMTKNPERMVNVSAFARVVENHALCTLSFHVSFGDIERAKRRIQVPGTPIDWGEFDNPYIFAFVSLVGLFHKEKAMVDRITGEHPVDFIFDERSEQRKILNGWNDYVANLPKDLGRQFGSIPRFENDSRFLALQGADYIAGWVRYWLEKGRLPDPGKDVFGNRTLSASKIPHFLMTISEDQIVEFLVTTIQRQLRNWRYVCDVKVTFEGETTPILRSNLQA